MQLFDVNILIAAYRTDSPWHQEIRPWLQGIVEGPEAYGVADLALSGFLRIVTHPNAFTPPEPMDDALVFAEYLRNRPNAVRVNPGARHWPIFTDLCRGSGVKGKLVPDAWFAALAIESGCEWVTLDRDYARFRGLRWCEPSCLTAKR